MSNLASRTADTGPRQDVIGVEPSNTGCEVEKMTITAYDDDGPKKQRGKGKEERKKVVPCSLVHSGVLMAGLLDRAADLRFFPVVACKGVLGARCAVSMASFYVFLNQI
jgi:hypothetical protein